MIDNFMEENGYAEMVNVIDGSYNGFISHPAFGLGCDTEDVIMRLK